MRNKNILIKNGVDVDKSLELFGTMEMYDESLGDFLKEIENKLYKISHFKEMGDMPNYAILTHSLKTDAKYFGFTKLAELSYAHELQSKENNIAFVNSDYPNLINEARRIVALVKNYLTGNETTSSEVKNECSALPTILIADDSEIITNFVKRVLDGKYNILVASDGQVAMNYIEKNNAHNIKALLLDLNMPNVDGFKVLEFMKQNNLFNTIPVSIITGNDNREIDLDAFQYPIVDILKKPFTEDAVKRILDKTLI
ncbi:MAG: response regulator [Bacilli bacterium]|nr:response regulator [Bacilli bacterium]